MVSPDRGLYRYYIECLCCLFNVGECSILSEFCQALFNTLVFYRVYIDLKSTAGLHRLYWYSAKPKVCSVAYYLSSIESILLFFIEIIVLIGVCYFTLL